MEKGSGDVVTISILTLIQLLEVKDMGHTNDLTKRVRHILCGGSIDFTTDTECKISNKGHCGKCERGLR